MTTTSDSAPAADDLQFDHAETPEGVIESRGAGPLVCAGCHRPIVTEYYQIADAVACADCKAAVLAAQEEAARQGRRASGLLRALVFGLGAALAGAAIYYAVLALANLEIALVALLIGYMVGWAVRRGSRDVGGRRYQVVALILTYISVGLAYSPLAFKGMMEGYRKSNPAVVAASKPAAPAAAPAPAVNAGRPAAAAPAQTAAAAPASAPATAAPPAQQPAPAARPAVSARKAAPAAAIGIMLVLTLILSIALPIMMIASTLPSGLLSAVIIGVGMRQAWKMTAAMAVPVSGPYRVGNARLGEAGS